MSSAPAAPLYPIILAPAEASIVWDAHPVAAELAQLDADSFAPAWSPSEYQGWVEHPHVTCWILRAGAPNQPDLAPIAWAVGQRIEGDAEILRLGVCPAWRRLGWGRVLLAGVQEWLVTAGATRVFLEVRAGNDPALALYRAVEFRESGRRRGYYPGLQEGEPREDAVLMTWTASTKSGR